MLHCCTIDDPLKFLRPKKELFADVLITWLLLLDNATTTTGTLRTIRPSFEVVKLVIYRTYDYSLVW